MSAAEGARAEVVCLCGSTRFRAEFTEANRRLTMAGAVVVAPGVFQHDGDPLTDEEKERLDALHFRKIDLADRVVVVAPGGYIGSSTSREVTYAKSTGKPVEVWDDWPEWAASRAVPSEDWPGQWHGLFRQAADRADQLAHDLDFARRRLSQIAYLTDGSDRAGWDVAGERMVLAAAIRTALGGPVDVRFESAIVRPPNMARPAVPSDPQHHDFVPVNGHPDDDECTHRADGTDATYCGEPESAHQPAVPSDHTATTEDARAEPRHLAPYGSTNALCDETVPRSTLWSDVAGNYLSKRFTVRWSETTCPECMFRRPLDTATTEDVPLLEDEDGAPFPEAVQRAHRTAVAGLVSPASTATTEDARKVLEAHRLISGRCRCGMDPRLDYYRYEQHVAEEFAAAGLLATACPDTTEAQAQALEGFARHLRDTYPEDVFPPLTPAAHKNVTDAIAITGNSRDSVSADVMRRAAAQADAHAAAIREGAGQ